MLIRDVKFDDEYEYEYEQTKDIEFSRDDFARKVQHKACIVLPSHWYSYSYSS